MSEQLYHIPELLWSFLMVVVRALSPGRKISDFPPSITKTVTIVVSLMYHTRPEHQPGTRTGVYGFGVLV